MSQFSVKFTERATRELKKMDKLISQMIYNWIQKNLERSVNPRLLRKALVSDKKGLWRYRIGDCRLICSTEDNELIILAVNAGHGKDVYKK